MVTPDRLCTSTEECPGPLPASPFGGPKLGKVIVFPPCTETPGIAGLLVAPLPEPPGPGYGEIPPFADGSDPRPTPSLPAPDPSPCNPLPGPIPLPIPFPPPAPPTPVFAVPVGDIAITPPLPAFGTPIFVPGCVDTTTPDPAALPPVLGGGPTATPRSSGPPDPAPLLPRPLPLSPVPPPRLGGGGTTALDPRIAPAPRSPVFPPPPSPVPDAFTGGATTCGVQSPPAFPRDEAPNPAGVGGGGTGFGRTSPIAVLPQLFRSRLTCDGGGATTDGAGIESFAIEVRSRCGAETGGATTFVGCVEGIRELARSRAVSLGDGATTEGFSGNAFRILSRATSGAGATTVDELKSGVLREFAFATSGAGGTTLAVTFGCLRVSAEFNSGEGATTLGVGNAGATNCDRNPSAGGGPGIGFTASKFATESECGRFSLGASTTLSDGRSPRATRIVCVRWPASCPPAVPVCPACAPPLSRVWGSSSP